MELFSYLQGIAGTGKSYQLKKLSDSNPDHVLCATTGIAAVNLGAGITINSLLWYFNSESLLDAWTSGKLDYRLGEVYGKLGVKRILLDEVSMLSASDLSVICLAIDRLNDTLAKKNKQPLGLTLAGDFAQLPPVKGDFAFESEQWEKFEHTTTILREVYRQSDKEFIEALGWVRKGEGKKAAEYFEENMNRLGDPKFTGTTLFPYNSAVDRQNAYKLEKVDGKKVSFTAKRSGKQRPEWNKYIPDTLELKIGALVMILANNYEGGSIEYCNGDLGILKEVGRYEGDLVAFVELQRTNDEVMVRIIGRSNEEIVEGKKKVVGGIQYMPLRLAYATTVHKSQGLTMDKVQVDFRAKFFAETPGMLYVALSRCRTKEGLRLIGSPRTFVQRCTVNDKIKRFL